MSSYLNKGVYIYTNFKNCNDYWKLKSYNNLSAKEMKDMLEARNYHVGSKDDKQTLRKNLQRTDLGLQSYINLSNEDLRQLIRARGVQTNFPRNNKGSREELIYALEDEDYNPRFEWFTRLPPELRNRVYEYYFSEFNEPLHAPKQPPLTLTCSLIRSEALPVFYASCTFQLRMFLPWHNWRTGISPSGIVMPMETLMWLHSTREENLADIQRLGVSVWQNVSRCNERACTVEILLENDNLPTSSSSNNRQKWFAAKPEFWSGRQAARMKKDAGKVLREIRGREKGWRVEREDFFRLRRAIEGPYP